MVDIDKEPISNENNIKYLKVYSNILFKYTEEQEKKKEYTDVALLGDNIKEEKKFFKLINIDILLIILWFLVLYSFSYNIVKVRNFQNDLSNNINESKFYSETFYKSLSDNIKNTNSDYSYESRKKDYTTFKNINNKFELASWIKNEFAKNVSYEKYFNNNIIFGNCWRITMRLYNNNNNNDDNNSNDSLIKNFYNKKKLYEIYSDTNFLKEIENNQNISYPYFDKKWNYNFSYGKSYKKIGGLYQIICENDYNKIQEILSQDSFYTTTYPYFIPAVILTNYNIATVTLDYLLYNPILNLISYNALKFSFLPNTKTYKEISTLSASCNQMNLCFIVSFFVFLCIFIMYILKDVKKYLLVGFNLYVKTYSCKFMTIVCVLLNMLSLGIHLLFQYKIPNLNATYENGKYKIDSLYANANSDSIVNMFYDMERVILYIEWTKYIFIFTCFITFIFSYYLIIKNYGLLIKKYNNVEKNIKKDFLYPCSIILMVVFIYLSIVSIYRYEVFNISENENCNMIYVFILNICLLFANFQGFNISSIINTEGNNLSYFYFIPTLFFIFTIIFSYIFFLAIKSYIKRNKKMYKWYMRHFKDNRTLSKDNNTDRGIKIQAYKKRKSIYNKNNEYNKSERTVETNICNEERSQNEIKTDKIEKIEKNENEKQGETPNENIDKNIGDENMHNISGNNKNIYNNKSHHKNIHNNNSVVYNSEEHGNSKSKRSKELHIPDLKEDSIKNNNGNTSKNSYDNSEENNIRNVEYMNEEDGSECYNFSLNDSSEGEINVDNIDKELNYKDIIKLGKKSNTNKEAYYSNMMEENEENIFNIEKFINIFFNLRNRFLPFSYNVKKYILKEYNKKTKNKKNEKFICYFYICISLLIFCSLFIINNFKKISETENLLKYQIENVSFLSRDKLFTNMKFYHENKSLNININNEYLNFHKIKNKNDIIEWIKNCFTLYLENGTDLFGNNAIYHNSYKWIELYDLLYGKIYVRMTSREEINISDNIYSNNNNIICNNRQNKCYTYIRNENNILKNNLNDILSLIDDSIKELEISFILSDVDDHHNILVKINFHFTSTGYISKHIHFDHLFFNSFNIYQIIGVVVNVLYLIVLLSLLIVIYKYYYTNFFYFYNICISSLKGTTHSNNSNMTHIMNTQMENFNYRSDNNTGNLQNLDNTNNFNVVNINNNIIHNNNNIHNNHNSNSYIYSDNIMFDKYKDNNMNTEEINYYGPYYNENNFTLNNNYISNINYHPDNFYANVDINNNTTKYNLSLLLKLKIYLTYLFECDIIKLFIFILHILIVIFWLALCMNINRISYYNEILLDSYFDIHINTISFYSIMINIFYVFLFLCIMNMFFYLCKYVKNEVIYEALYYNRMQILKSVLLLLFVCFHFIIFHYFFYYGIDNYENVTIYEHVIYSFLLLIGMVKMEIYLKFSTLYFFVIILPHLIFIRFLCIYTLFAPTLSSYIIIKKNRNKQSNNTDNISSDKIYNIESNYGDSSMYNMENMNTDLMYHIDNNNNNKNNIKNNNKTKHLCNEQKENNTNNQYDEEDDIPFILTRLSSEQWKGLKEEIKEFAKMETYNILIYFQKFKNQIDSKKITFMSTILKNEYNYLNEQINNILLDLRKVELQWKFQSKLVNSSNAYIDKINNEIDMNEEEIVESKSKLSSLKQYLQKVQMDPTKEQDE
ncbi:conserved Plasmodium membrane protein, unknown function [Plasmodium sp. gorilla clade G2]|uniref:conserved Plasmodium membrane protein, unknown function n=1 Tax=Plasmodium sp. gorilla clade G2 TaxID=880535 RepID=UPI000D1FE1A4|nr:conserved Plasmodium membrane protein, unknown function [Plasmodium sp. gorilla clade G2]SOV17547.1 conserved Plasmodium membrane protein, unknown function [Plasmodium sp. gorilla clade G2]